MGLEYACAARADDHGALAARPVRQVLARLCDRQCRVPRPAAVARSFRRAPAYLPRDHAQRLQPAAGQPRQRACRERRSARRAGDQPNYLSEEEDRRVAADCDPPDAPNLPPRPRWRATRRKNSGRAPQLQSEEDLAKAAGDIGTTIFHPVGTAKMGPRRPDAVVDERLRVRGLEGLRIADASVMPRITSGNTNSPTLMIAEKAAEMILADAKTAEREGSRRALIRARRRPQSETALMIARGVRRMLRARGFQRHRIAAARRPARRHRRLARRRLAADRRDQVVGRRFPRRP